MVDAALKTPAMVGDNAVHVGRDLLTVPGALGGKTPQQSCISIKLNSARSAASSDARSEVASKSPLSRNASRSPQSRKSKSSLPPDFVPYWSAWPFCVGGRKPGLFKPPKFPVRLQRGTASGTRHSFGGAGLPGGPMEGEYGDSSGNLLPSGMPYPSSPSGQDDHSPRSMGDSVPQSYRNPSSMSLNEFLGTVTCPECSKPFRCGPYPRPASQSRGCQTSPLHDCEASEGYGFGALSEECAYAVGRSTASASQGGSTRINPKGVCVPALDLASILSDSSTTSSPHATDMLHMDPSAVLHGSTGGSASEVLIGLGSRGGDGDTFASSSALPEGQGAFGTGSAFSAVQDDPARRDSNSTAEGSGSLPISKAVHSDESPGYDEVRPVRASGLRGNRNLYSPPRQPRRCAYACARGVRSPRDYVGKFSEQSRRPEPTMRRRRSLVKVDYEGMSYTERRKRLSLEWKGMKGKGKGRDGEATDEVGNGTSGKERPKSPAEDSTNAPPVPEIKVEPPPEEPPPDEPPQEDSSAKGKGKGLPKPPPPAKGKGKGNGDTKASPRRPASNGRTKPLLWSMFSEVNDETLWAKRRSLMDSLQLDREALGRLFMCHAGNAVFGGGAEEAEERKKISLTTRARTMRISIGIHRLRWLGPEGIRAAILALDPDILTPDAVEMLLARDARTNETTVLPIADEQAAAALHIASGASNDLLDDASQFIVAVHGIPHLEARLEFHWLRMGLADNVTSFRKPLNMLTAALQEVRDSERLSAILMFVLQAGNCLNEGTIHGDARGFRMESLPKLAHLKGADKNAPTGTSHEKSMISLLAYIVDTISQQRPDLLELGTDFEHLPLGCRIELQEVERGLRQLRSDLLRLQSTLCSESGSECEDDPGLLGAADFFQKAFEVVTELEAEVEAVRALYREVLAFFGENCVSTSEKVPLHEWLGYINSFITDLRRERVAKINDMEQKQRRHARRSTMRHRRTSSSRQTMTSVDSASSEQVFASLSPLGRGLDKRRKRAFSCPARGRRRLKSSGSRRSSRGSIQSPKADDGSGSDSSSLFSASSSALSPFSPRSLPQKRRSWDSVIGGLSTPTTQTPHRRKRLDSCGTNADETPKSPADSSALQQVFRIRSISFDDRVEFQTLPEEDGTADDMHRITRQLLTCCYSRISRRLERNLAVETRGQGQTEGDAPPSENSSIEVVGVGAHILSNVLDAHVGGHLNAKISQYQVKD